VVGFSDNANARRHAFRWTETDGMVDLDSANGPNGTSRAYGVSGDGSVVVGMTDFPNFRSGPFVWTAGGGFRDLGIYGCAYAVTADGSVVVGGDDIKATAFRWTEAGGLQDLGTLNGQVPNYLRTVATGVSDDGQVVVGSAGVVTFLDFIGSNFTPFGYDSNYSRPFVWTATTGMQDLNQILANAGVDLTGITLLGITGVSTDGQYVCGVARTPQNDPNDPGDLSGFIAQLP
jgi:probable HAF family extracellular repeat protein